LTSRSLYVTLSTTNRHTQRQPPYATTTGNQMGPNQPADATPENHDPYAPRSVPGPDYYYAPPYDAPYYAPPPIPMPLATTTQARPTWLGRWGLGCSILALVLPIMSVLVGITGGARAAPAMGMLTLLALLFAVLGVVFSSVGMSRRYTGRGLAIAGLTVGIIALAPLFLGVLAGVAAFSLG
jgi:hypothetical protein